MDNIHKLFTNQKEAIFVGIVSTVVGGLLLTFLTNIISIIKVKLSSKALQKPEGQAIYLNSSKRSFVDNCIGRENSLDEVYAKIVENNHFIPVRKSIAIIGEEGIGKTLFCHTLFQYYLNKHSVYLGWIDCNGKQSIFDIIKTSFDDSRFHRKSKENILNILNSMDMDKPYILFADQIDQHTPIDELEELSQCKNVILILSGTFKKINFVDCYYELSALSDVTIRNIFEKNPTKKFC